MAAEPYRAVFIRVHPTGKMVLSLTTEPDGHEADYAEQVATTLGIAALDVKVVPADSARFGEQHGFNTAPSPATAQAIASATDKLMDKARLLAGAAMQAAPEQLTWEDGRFLGPEDQSTTIADVAFYSYGSGELPPGVEGGLDAQTVYRDDQP